MDTYAVSEAHVKVVENNVKPNIEGESVSAARPFQTANVADILAYDFELDN